MLSATLLPEPKHNPDNESWKPCTAVLAPQFEADKDSKAAASMARVLFDTALLESGFDLEAPKAFNARVYELMAGAFGIKGDLSVSPADAEAAAAADDVRPHLPSTPPAQRTAHSMPARPAWLDIQRCCDANGNLALASMPLQHHAQKRYLLLTLKVA